MKRQEGTRWTSLQGCLLIVSLQQRLWAGARVGQRGWPSGISWLWDKGKDRLELTSPSMSASRCPHPTMTFEAQWPGPPFASQISRTCPFLRLYLGTTQEGRSEKCNSAITKETPTVLQQCNASHMHNLKFHRSHILQTGKGKGKLIFMMYLTRYVQNII